MAVSSRVWPASGLSGLDPHLGHLQVAPELLDPAYPRADADRSAGGERRAQDVARREDGRGAGEHHGLAVERLLDQRQDRRRGSRAGGPTG